MKSNARILIAEDENIIARDIASTLKAIGYEVVGFVRDGRKILEEAKKLKPDLILMDIMLDGNSSGIEAADQVREHLDIPVIFLTALADEETLSKAKVSEPFGYLIKPFDARMLHSSIEMAVYKHQINLKLKERTRELEEEKLKSEKLLQNILPAEIIKELKEKGVVEPREFKAVTLLFTDFQGFTTMSSGMHPRSLVSELNDIFMNFDHIIDKYGLEKFKTIGDSYMVGGGIPKECDDHAVRTLKAAIDMQVYITERNKNSAHKWQMRAGLHSGNVVAGIVGKNKFTYDVWGDTVNIASIMERYSLPGKINITTATYELVKDCYKCEYQGKVNVAGKGLIKRYFVSYGEKEIQSLEAITIHD
jgi:class 3 adenylate cyclase